MRSLCIPLVLCLACTPRADGESKDPVEDTDQGQAQTDTSVQWEALSEEDLAGGEKDSGGGGDKDEDCGAEVVQGAACEGDWTTTICVDEEGEYWWCEDGVWTTGK